MSGDKSSYVNYGQKSHTRSAISFDLVLHTSAHVGGDHLVLLGWELITKHETISFCSTSAGPSISFSKEFALKHKKSGLVMWGGPSRFTD